MLEANYKKNKINLEDYDYQQDIKNRLLMSHFSTLDIEMLEAILYSPISFPAEKLFKSLSLSPTEGWEALKKLDGTSLFSIQGTEVHVDKEMRKYFEHQIIKFDDEFTPGMEFLQTLLKKVPIHVLPSWYPIPRTSNNIFDSLVEKYLATPQIFQRYLSDLNFGDERMNGIVKTVFNSPNYEIASSVLLEKFHLTKQDLEEIILQLEFNFVCCLVYRKKGDEYEEFVTLFSEWKEYLQFLSESQPQPIKDITTIVPYRPHHFSFIDDLSSLLKLIQKKSLPLVLMDERWHFDRAIVASVEESLGGSIPKGYLSRLIHKILFLKLGNISESTLQPLPGIGEFLAMPQEKRALSMYKHTITYYPYSEFTSKLSTERNIHEIENSLARVIHSGWVYYDHFLNGVIVPISESSKVMLKKKGRSWHYSLPDYTPDEKRLIKLITQEWLFEAGVIALGLHEDRVCMQVTPLGKQMFS